MGRSGFSLAAAVATAGLLALHAPAARADKWTKTDTAVEAACAGLLIADWGQTLDRRYEESNPILGKRPTEAAVTGYFLGVITLHLAIARVLPRPWRTLFQGTTIGVEGHSIYANWRLGAHFSW